MERLWSILKRLWQQGLYHFSDELAQLQKKKEAVPRESIFKLYSILSKCILFRLFTHTLNQNKIDGINTQTVKNIARSHYRGMLSVLNGQLV